MKAECNRLPISSFLQALLLISTLNAASCGKTSLSQEAYIRWVGDPENGLSQQQKTSELQYTLLFKPKPYVVLKTMPTAGKDRGSFDTAENDLDDLNYASLWLESADGTDLLKRGRPAPEELDRRARYCSFDIQHDLALIEGPDTLACVFAHWERLGSLTSRQHFILAFEKSRAPAPCDKVFLFKNRLLSEETVRFTIPQKALEQVPTLAF